MIHQKQDTIRSGNTMNKLMATLVLLALTAGVFCQSSHKKAIYIAFITHDMAKWDNTIRTIEAANSANTVEQKLEFINDYYGYIGWLVGQKQYAKAEKLIPKGEKLINQVLDMSPKNATAYSFKGSFLGFKIAIDKYKAIFLESESKKCINKALELDPENIQALIDKGNILFYAPHLLGGNKKEALNYFLKAERQMERNKETCQNWVYLNLLSIIATTYEKTNKLEEAKLVYEKIIRNEPDIRWVKDGLYPNLLAKIKA